MQSPGESSDASRDGGVVMGEEGPSQPLPPRSFTIEEEFTLDLSAFKDLILVDNEGSDDDDATVQLSNNGNKSGDDHDDHDDDDDDDGDADTVTNEHQEVANATQDDDDDDDDNTEVEETKKEDDNGDKQEATKNDDEKELQSRVDAAIEAAKTGVAMPYDLMLAALRTKLGATSATATTTGPVSLVASTSASRDMFLETIKHRLRLQEGKPYYEEYCEYFLPFIEGYKAMCDLNGDVKTFMVFQELGAFGLAKYALPPNATLEQRKVFTAAFFFKYASHHVESLAKKATTSCVLEVAKNQDAIRHIEKLRSTQN